MTTSPEINELAAALAQAQGEIEGAVKGSDNPFFKSKYADLASVWDAVRAPLSKHGLSVLQLPRTDYAGTPEIYEWTSRQGETRVGVRVLCTVSVLTRLMHSSGQWIENDVSAMLPSADPQAIGSAITYLRRYSLAGVGVAPEDDDDEAAQGRGQTTKTPARTVPDGYDAWLSDMMAVAENGKAAFEAAWGQTKAEYRNHLVGTDRALWLKLKAAAASVKST